jgi:hypothetical protein
MSRITRSSGGGKGSVKNRLENRPETKRRKVIRKPQILPDGCLIEAQTVVRLPDGGRAYKHCDGKVYPYPEFQTPLFDTTTGEYIVEPGTLTDVSKWQLDRLKSVLGPYLPLIYGVLVVFISWQLIKLVYKSDL